MNVITVRHGAVLAETVKTAILYDRLETMLAANQLVSQLPLCTNRHADWVVNSWQFDPLGRGNEGELALGDTSEADLLIVAFGDTESLRRWPEDWVTRWASNHQANSAKLVLMLVRAAHWGDCRSQIIAPLLILAEKHSLEFFIVDDSRTDVEWCRVNPLGLSHTIGLTTATPPRRAIGDD